MSNYFRVTAYHESENLSVIIDSNGYFSEIWELSALMIQKGFKVLEVSDGGDGDGVTLLSVYGNK